MKLRMWQVDAFTSRVFAGNPAAVVPLQEWLPDATMQAIARENNLSETAFLVRERTGHRLRWFTPGMEGELWGHGTLATAYGHMSRVAVSVGQHVTRGQTLGAVGCTGHCFGDHVHFEVRVNGSAVNPIPYM